MPLKPLIVLPILALALAATPATQRQPIGEVFGQPVYQDQIDTAKDGVQASLNALFFAPVYRRFIEAHADELKVTDAEIQGFLEHSMQRAQRDLAAAKEKTGRLREELARPDLAEKDRALLERRLKSAEDETKDAENRTNLKLDADFARWYLGNLKVQRLLHQKYGGRVIWQQVGPEAAGAMRQLLLDAEKSGAFRISDPELSRELHAYWDRIATTGIEVRGESLEEFAHPPWTPTTRPAK